MGQPTEFGRILAELREERGWKRPELATRSGVSYDYIVKIEDGNRKDPGFTKARKLARALRVPLTRFAGERQPKVERALAETRSSPALAAVVDETGAMTEEEWEWLQWFATGDAVEGHLTPYFLAGNLRLRRADLARQRQ